MPAARQIGRSHVLRTYVMLIVALEQERLFIAERLLTEIERRHGLPHPVHHDLHPVIIDRFLTAYLPAAREGAPAPSALEYTCTPTMTDALVFLQGIVDESPAGSGAAIYIHDLDTGTSRGEL
jgi:hypothetical protein